MKKGLFIMLLAICSVCCKGYGNEKMSQGNQNYGYQSYGKETVKSIHANGFVSLEGTKVEGMVQVNGSLEADESAMESLEVNGQVGLKNSLIRGTSIINGALIADNTKFQKELSVASQKILLRTCSVDSLRVREVVGFDGVQVIDLRSGTKITGSIVVESGNGEIWLSSNSEVSGPISGAKVFKK